MDFRRTSLTQRMNSLERFKKSCSRPTPLGRTATECRDYNFAATLKLKPL
jgi:hypothetical protein